MRVASNPNTFHVELVIAIRGVSVASLILPPSGRVTNVAMMPAPQRGHPHSAEWCTQYGIISPDALAKGIVFKRSNNDLVVYRTFR